MIQELIPSDRQRTVEKLESTFKSQKSSPTTSEATEQHLKKEDLNLF